MIETSKMPKMMAPLTRYNMSITVRTPPQKMPIHIVGLRILYDPGQTPVSSMFSGLHPASSSGVDAAPVIKPIPAEYASPMIVR